MFYDSNLYGYIFLGCRVNGRYIESKPIKIILCINMVSFSILLILTIIKLVRKDDELSMYSSLLLFGCSNFVDDANVTLWFFIWKKYRNSYGRNSLCYAY